MRRRVSALAVVVVALSVQAPAAAALRLPRALRRRGVYTDRPDMPPLRQVAEKLDVNAPWTAPRWVWATAWRSGKRALPLLHARDPCAPADTCVNLNVLWLKAIAGNRRRTDDGGLAYDLLPPVTRRLVARPLSYLYPRLHHQNVALRTAYLDRAVATELAAAPRGSTAVVLGAGFDVRPLRLAEPAKAEGAPTRWAEIDLPEVVEQKARLLRRVRGRRPAAAAQIDRLVQLQANLTDAAEARAAVRSALAEGAAGRRGARGHAVFVCEALMIYMPRPAAARLLAICAEEARRAGFARAALCFADALPEVEGTSMESARRALARAGFALESGSWLPKPGLARHMGVAAVGAERPQISG